MPVYWTPGSINPELVYDSREGVTNLGVYDPSETTYVFDHQGSVGIVNPDNSITFRPDIYFENLDDGSITLTQGDGTPYGKLLVAARQDELRVSPDRETIYNQLTQRNREAVARDAGGFDPTGLIVALSSLALAPVTGGASLAIGEAILGAGAVGAATVGAAVLSSATSAVVAAMTDGDIGKSAITGAITGGIGANASDIGTSIAGGTGNVKEIATALDLTEKQVTSAITKAVTNGVVASAITGADVGQTIATSLASSVVGSYTSNLVGNIPDLQPVANVVGNVTGVVSNAVVSGGNINDALLKNSSSIIDTNFDNTDPLTADDVYTGQAMTNLASSDDATRLAQMLQEFGNPTELTGSTIDVASNPTVELGNATVDESLGLPNVPSNLQNEAYLDPSLIDVAPENVTIGTPDTPTYYDASPTFPTINVSPEYDPSAYLPTNLGGFDNIPSNLGTNVGGGTQDLGGLDVPFNTPTDLSAGELTVTGERPYVPFEENFPLPYEPFEEDFPLQTETTETTTETTPVTKPKLLSNILKSTPSALPKAIASQQQSNLANILRGSQMQQTALPAIYKQANPFNFGQQATPVQDVSALAKLLRTA